MSLVKNTEIVELNKELSSVNPGTLTTLGTNNAGYLTVFSSRINSVINSSSDDAWADSVKGGITESIAAITGEINNTINAANFVSGAAAPVNNLKTACDTYVKKYGEYYSLVDARRWISKYISVGEPDENGVYKQEINPKYAENEQKIEAYEESIPLLESEALRLKQAVTDYFSACNFETMQMDASFDVNSTDIQFDFSDYFDGLMEVTLEEWITRDESIEIDENGHIIQTIQGEVVESLAGGCTFKGEKGITYTYDDINHDGVIDENDRKIAEEVVRNGYFTTPEGITYGLASSELSDENGVVKIDIKLTDADGNDVFSSETNRDWIFFDGFGANNSSYTKVEKTGNEVTVTTTNVSECAGGERSSEHSFSYNVDDPTCGTCVGEDGAVYKYYRDDQGRLHQTSSRPDKNKTNSDGTPVMTEEKDVIIDESATQTVILKNNETGEVTSFPFNPNSQLDRARAQGLVDGARNDCGCYLGLNDVDPSYMVIADAEMYSGMELNAVADGTYTIMIEGE